MADTRLKKVIVAATIALVFILWWAHHPRSIKAHHTDITYKYITKKYNDSGINALPLTIALHGNGDKIKNFQKTLFHDLSSPTRIVFVQGPKKYQTGYAWPMSGPELMEYGDALADIVAQLSAKYEPPKKPVLVGFSGGGCMAYYQAAVHPDLYSTIIPISGSLNANVIENAPGNVWSTTITALHGKSDNIIRLSAGKRAIALLEELGRTVEFVAVPGNHLAVFTSAHEIFKEIFKESVE